MRAILKTAALAAVAVVGVSGCSTKTEDVEMITGAISSTEGKPGAPVSLAYKVPAAPALGTAIDIVITVTIDSPVDRVEINMTKSEGLELVSAPRLELGAQKPGSTHEMIVSVIPWEAGMRFVNVFALTENGSQSSRRSFAIPVTGGGDQTPQKASGTLKEMPDGEKVISLPAEED